MATSITIRGYISHIDEKNIILDGCDPSVWKVLPASYFAKNIRKRVSGDLKTCTIRITKSTTCMKGPRAELVSVDNMQSCYVSVMAVIKKYKFRAGTQNIEGWCITAHHIRTIQIA